MCTHHQYPCNVTCITTIYVIECMWTMPHIDLYLHNIIYDATAQNMSWPLYCIQIIDIHYHLIYINSSQGVFIYTMKSLLHNILLFDCTVCAFYNIYFESCVCPFISFCLTMSSSVSYLYMCTYVYIYIILWLYSVY